MFGIIPQSLTRCFTTVVVPDVIAESQEVTVNDLSEEAARRGDPLTDDGRQRHRLHRPGDWAADHDDPDREPVPLPDLRPGDHRAAAVRRRPGRAGAGRSDRVVRAAEALVYAMRCSSATSATWRPARRSASRSCAGAARHSGQPGGSGQKTAADLDFGAWARAIDELEAARRTSWLPRPAATHSRIVRTADGFTTAPVYTDMESLFVALYRDFAGCVALTIVDESHNAMGENTDIARSIHYAQLAAQTYIYASGTHYAGTLDRFYHYWYRFHPQFLAPVWVWLGRHGSCSAGLRRDPDLIREYPERANKGTGAQSRTSTNSVLAPGHRRGAVLPTGSHGFITIHDVGALMPEKREFPRLVSMHDPVLDAVRARTAETGRGEAWIAARNLEAA